MWSGSAALTEKGELMQSATLQSFTISVEIESAMVYSPPLTATLEGDIYVHVRRIRRVDSKQTSMKSIDQFAHFRQYLGTQVERGGSKIRTHRYSSSTYYLEYTIVPCPSGGY